MHLTKYIPAIFQQAHSQALDGEDGLQIWVCEYSEQQSQTTTVRARS
jgi:hypothetical protein